MRSRNDNCSMKVKVESEKAGLKLNIIFTPSGSVTKRLVAFCFKTSGEFGFLQTEQLAQNNVFQAALGIIWKLKKKSSVSGLYP